jgi:hypothetical protein
MKTLIDAQQEAIDAIVALRKMAKPSVYSRTKRLPRSVGAILLRYAAFATKRGFTTAQIYQHRHDIIDMVVLADNAEV